MTYPRLQKSRKSKIVLKPVMASNPVCIPLMYLCRYLQFEVFPIQLDNRFLILGPWIP